jgi:2-methylcitrate dehydratase PrpD
MTADTPPVTRRLADFAAGLRREHLPPYVQELLPLLLVDFMRAAAVGRRQPWTAKAAAALLPLSGEPRCRILFTDRRADPVRAAYQNGVAAGSLDWDDSHIGALVHPGIVVWPAALAAAELAGASGLALLEAAAAGYETAVRIGMGLQPDHALRGYQATASCGVFGAAVAAGRLLGLDAEGLRHALGIAASYASGSSQFFLSGSDVKRLHAGKAAAGGVEIALLVRAGLTGPADAIEGAQGFARAASDTVDLGTMVGGLGTRFWTDAIALKMHAGTVRLAAAIEAAEALARTGIRPGDIAAIEIGMPRILLGKISSNAPADMQQAQMSAPFAVAMTFHLVARREGPLIVGLDEFATLVDDAGVRALAALTDCVFDAEMDAAMTAEQVPARVSVTLRDGGQHVAKIMLPKGCRGNPITPAEVHARFRVLTADVLPSAAAEAWLADAAALHLLPSASAIML